MQTHTQSWTFDITIYSWCELGMGGLSWLATI